MLKSIASRFQTAVLVFIVSLISAVFVLQFGGPQAEGCGGVGAAYVAKVKGEAITAGDVEAQKKLARLDRFPEELAAQLGVGRMALDGIVERMLLASEAAAIGLDVSEEDVMHRIAESGQALVTVGGSGLFGGMGGGQPIPIQDAEGNFDKEATKRFVQFGLQRSIGGFLEGQRQERLAQIMRDLVASTVTVTESELWELYQRQEYRRSVSYLRFSPKYYAAQIPDDREAANAWASKHANEVSKELEMRKKEGATAPDRDAVVMDLWRAARADTLAAEAADAWHQKLRAGATSWASAEATLEQAAMAEAGKKKDPAMEEEGAAEATEEEGGNPLAPRVKVTEQFGPADTPVTGAFDGGRFSEAAFEIQEQGAMRSKVLNLDGERFVMRVDEVLVPDPDTFASEKDKLLAGALKARREEALNKLVSMVRKANESSIKYASRNE